MSMAPANRASIAAGPALKVFHSILTAGDAFSKNPLASPTLACECLMFGNAPTRIVVAPPWAQPATAHASHEASTARTLLFTLVSPDYHAEHAARFSLLWRALFSVALGC